MENQKNKILFLEAFLQFVNISYEYGLFNLKACFKRKNMLEV